MIRRAEGVWVILLAAVLFGALAVCVRAAATAMPPMQIAFVRFAGALALMLAVGGRGALRPHRAPLVMLILRGLLGAAAIVLWFHGIRDAGATTATLLHATYPVWATLLAVVLLGEPFSQRIALALGLELAGVALVVGPGASGGAHATRGALLSLAAGVLAGAAVTTARQLRATESATVVTTWFMATGAVCTAPVLLGGGATPSAPLAMVLAGVVLTATGGQWLLHHGLGLTTAARGSIIAATSVVTTAALEAVWLGDPPAPRMLAGAVLMVLAVALAAGGPTPPIPDAWPRPRPAAGRDGPRMPA